jgi:phospholipase/carboxylesterase
MMMKSFGSLSGHFNEPARGGTPSSLIIIMHGWGADANDLADLAYPMSLRFPGAAFFIPNAPDPCSMNPMGRQWFDLADTRDGPAAAAAVIEASVVAAIAELDLDMDAVALTGFSQGGMMSLHCGLHMADRPQAVVSFSGALLGVDDSADIDGRPAVMLIHGTDDQVVPFSMMEAASTILATHGIEVACVTRPGLGHGIDPDALTKAIDFLAMHMPD